MGSSVSSKASGSGMAMRIFSKTMERMQRKSQKDLFHRVFSLWSGANVVLTGTSDPGRKQPPRDLVVTASPRSSFFTFNALAGTWEFSRTMSSSIVVKVANSQKFLQSN